MEYIEWNALLNKKPDDILYNNRYINFAKKQIIISFGM